MAISPVAGVSSNALAAAQFQARGAQAAAVTRLATGSGRSSDALSAVTLSNAGLASAALATIAENAANGVGLLADTSTLRFTTTLAASLSVAPLANGEPAPAAAAATNATSVTNAAETAPVTAPTGPAAASAAPAAGEDAAVTAEAAAQSLAAQAELVQRRIAQDIATAFKVIAIDQTYSSAATALYMSAAVYRLQTERPKEADLLLQGPVQPVKSVDAIAALGDFGVGDSTAKAR